MQFGVLTQSHTTFSLLPDGLAARLPSELDHIEAVVAHAERAPSRSALAKSGPDYVPSSSVEPLRCV